MRQFAKTSLSKYKAPYLSEACKLVKKIEKCHFRTFTVRGGADAIEVIASMTSAKVEWD